MIPLSSLLGQQAVSLADAERTGKVKGVVLDGDRVVAVDIGSGVVAASGVRSFEGDVLTYDPGHVADAAVAERASDPLGRRILDDLGDGLGNLRDLQLDADGRVEAVVLDDGSTLPGGSLLAVGSYAVVVRHRQ